MRHYTFLGIFAGLFPSLAFAHVTGSPADGFSGGFMHTFSGLDHLAAIWCLGAIAALFAQKATITSAQHEHHWFYLPGLFVVGSVLGGFCGVQGLAINPEPVIGFSVIFWSALIIWRKHLSFTLHAAASVLFAFFHGLAHGPLFANLHQPLLFCLGLGFAFSLSFIGGFIATQRFKIKTNRWATGIVSLAGLYSYFGLGSLL